METKHYIYILRCADGTYYTGYSTDPVRRAGVHNSGKGARYTRARRPVELIYTEEFEDKVSAMRREWAIKQLTRDEKESLISGTAANPAFVTKERDAMSKEIHTHEEIHEHKHFHSDEEKKKQLNRISRAMGHLRHVKLMIENDEDCADVLVQLSAVNSALKNLGKEIINEHMTHCIIHAIEDGDMEEVDEFLAAIKKFL